MFFRRKGIIVLMPKLKMKQLKKEEYMLFKRKQTSSNNELCHINTSFSMYKSKRGAEEIPWRISSNLGCPIHFLRLSFEPVKKLSTTMTWATQTRSNPWKQDSQTKKLPTSFLYLN